MEDVCQSIYAVLDCCYGTYFPFIMNVLGGFETHTL